MEDVIAVPISGQPPYAENIGSSRYGRRFLETLRPPLTGPTPYAHRLFSGVADWSFDPLQAATDSA